MLFYHTKYVIQKKAQTNVEESGDEDDESGEEI